MTAEQLYKHHPTDDELLDALEQWNLPDNPYSYPYGWQTEPLQ